jgi:hypothetical protein
MGSARALSLGVRRTLVLLEELLPSLTRDAD